MSSSDIDPAAGFTDALSAPVAREVAEDLESIFPATGAPAAENRRRLKLAVAREPRGGGKGRWSERRAASLGALLAATCVGVSAGALFARAPVKPGPPPVSPGVPISVVQPALPAPGPLATALAPAAPTATPAIAAEIAASAPDAPRPQVRAVSTARKSAHHRLVRTSASCGRSARCGAGSVMAADARLRRAYAAAERAGVSRATLAAYHSQWGRLRHRAPRQPSLVAARYRSMAADLDHMAAHQRVARTEPPRTGPWRRFRMQLAALWR